MESSNGDEAYEFTNGFMMETLRHRILEERRFALEAKVDKVLERIAKEKAVDSIQRKIRETKMISRKPSESSALPGHATRAQKCRR